MRAMTAAEFERISDDLELKAAAAAAHVLGAKLIRRDIAPAQNTRDFDLVLPDRSVEPLEVTQCADANALQTWDRIGAGIIVAPSLKRRWEVSVPNSVSISETERVPYDVRQFTQTIESALAGLEARGYATINLGRVQRDAALSRVFATLLDLRVQDGFSRPLPEGVPGHISFQALVGGITLPALIAIGVEREANKPDNLAKLADPLQARRRHLFVVFNGSSGSFFNAVDRAMESRLPRLPQPITTAWAACRGHVLVATPPGRWESYELPEDVFFTPERWLA